MEVDELYLDESDMNEIYSDSDPDPEESVPVESAPEELISEESSTEEDPEESTPEETVLEELTPEDILGALQAIENTILNDDVQLDTSLNDLGLTSVALFFVIFLLLFGLLRRDEN